MLRFREWLMNESSDEEAFLNAILSNNRDDTVLLVYADWLDEHQDADPLNAVLAEYIRLATQRIQLGDRRPKKGVSKRAMHSRLQDLIPQVREIVRAAGVRTYNHHDNEYTFLHFDPDRTEVGDTNRPGEQTIEYYPNGKDCEFSRSYPGGGQSEQVPLSVPPHGMIARRRMPWGPNERHAFGANNHLPDDDPDHPSQWPHPYAGHPYEPANRVAVKKALVVRMIGLRLPLMLGSHS